MRFSSLFPLLLSLSAVSSCALMGDSVEDAKWVEYELQSPPPMRDLMDACNWAMVRSKFPPGELDVVDHRLVSGWDVQLAPYSNRGRRSQAMVEAVDLESGKVLLKVRVKVQANKEKHQPLILSEAKWEDSHEDPARARILLEHVLYQVEPRGGAR